MKICFFGDYDPEYTRNRVLLTGLKEVGAEVIECRTNKKNFNKYIDLFSKFRDLNSDFDVCLVGYSNSMLVPLVYLMTRRPVVWDAFYSRYDTLVNDRKLVSRYSIKALYYWFLEWLSVRLATMILLDTNTHIAYFRSIFGGREGKYSRVLVGTEHSN